MSVWLVVAVVLGVAAVAWVDAAPANAGPALSEAEGPVAVRLWDTVTPLSGQADVAQHKIWLAVTAAGSGHLRGDLVVETDAVGAAFASRLGKVLVYSKAEPSQRKAEIAPAEVAGKQAVIAATAIAEENGGLAVQVVFRASGAGSFPITFSFTDDRFVAVTPQGDTRAVSLSAPIELAMVPSFVGDDLIYDPRDYPSANALSLPSEHFLLGLLKGEGSMLVMTWQEDMPSVSAIVSNSGDASISAVTFAGGRKLSLAVLDAPGIWHRETLKPSFLERDVAIAWKPPFPAIWLTQLYEDEVKTTFEFRHTREDTWRGAVGNYTYPTWFSDGKTMLSLGKKIPPEGEAIIYFLERSDDTPQQVLSPIDIVQRTLTGDVLARILDVEGRPTWYPHRENSVLGGATCGVTDALKKIFDAGQEVEKQDLVKAGMEDMYAYLEGMFAGDARFYPFAKDIIAYLDAQEKAKPELAPFLAELRSTAGEMMTTYDDARDTIRDINYAHELGAQTIALAAEKRPDNPQRFMELKQDWTGMGGSLEGLARKEHTLTRKLYQQAGYGAATSPDAIPVAEEVRRLTKQCLERPESYEIWENH
jgi:hypothetical protein